MSDINLFDLMEIKKHIDNGSFKIKVMDFEENEDGSAMVNFEMSEEFVTWFKERENLKRWSDKRFRKFFNKNLQKFLRVEQQTKQ